MSQTFNESVLIDGVQDEVQLTIQGTSGQSDALQTWEDHAGTEQARVTADGRFQNGDMSLSTPDALIEAHRDSSSSLPKRGFHSLGRIASALSDAVSWLVAELELIGTGTITGLHRVLRAKLSHSSTGDSSTAELRAGDLEVINQGGSSLTPLGKAVGLQVSIDNQNGAHLGDAQGVSSRIQNATGANIETAKAFEVPTVVNDGSIDTLIGLDIADMNEGSDNYAIRTGTGKVQFGELNAGLVKADVNGLLANAVKGIDFDSLMQGANSGANGVSGDVPQPLAGEQGKFLRGDGTWANPASVTSLDNLSDVNTTGASEDDILGYNGTAWVPQSLNLSYLLPAGLMMPYAGEDEPVGWLLCDGRAVSRNYENLYTLITNKYKRVASLTSRSSDSVGSIDLAYTGHNLTTGSGSPKLTLRFALASAQIASLVTATDIITTSAAHFFTTKDRVRVTSTGTLPTGIAANTDYFVRVLSTTTLTLHPSASDADTNSNIVNLTGAGTGTRTLIPQDEGIRVGMTIDNIVGSVLDLSGGTQNILPIVATTITVECEDESFFLPDMRGRVAVGTGQGIGLTNRTLAETFGEESHQLAISEMPSHTHSISGYGSGGGGITALQKRSDAVGATSFNTSSQGGGQAHNNMQPSLSLNYIVKV